MADTGAKRGLTSPPAGTGQVAGLGEAFRINLNTGQGVYSYKLPLPDGIAGFTPQLSLEYAHGNSHGLFGFGWRLPVRQISRRLDYGTGGDDLHEFFSDSGAEIMPIEDDLYGQINETGFARYHRLEEGWRIEERNGTVHHLGRHPDARLSDPDNPQRVTDWLLEESVDPCGNTITYRYVVDEGSACLSEIRYAAYAVRFQYETRPDQRWNGRAGYLRRVSKRCARIELYLDPGSGERLIRSWNFRYQVEESSRLSLLSQIELTSHGTAEDGSDDVNRPPVRFTYSSYDPQGWSAVWMQSEGAQPPLLDDPEAALIVLDNAPLPGILQVVGGKQYYWANQGDGTWAHPVPLQRQPLIGSFQREGVAFIDVDASGTADLLQAGSNEPIPGYYENGGREGWKRFVAYPRASRTKPAWASGNTRLTDADGNGQVDAIMSTRRAFAVWLNRGEEGWSEPLLAPKGSGEDRPDVDLGEPTVRLADMTGDGLQDLVRVRSGRVEFWPALGRGRYGPRIVMQNSPRLRDLHRLPENLHLMDVNGDGCDDLVFVTATAIEVYLNRNGESFSEASFLSDVPPAIPGTIRSVDMDGSGRAGLLYNSWTSRGSGYVRVKPAGQQLPYLLTGVDSGTGLRSEIRYRLAAEDYQRDRLVGEQWDTNFPFPLLVVASTREEDTVSGQVVETEYRYHEAHYEMRTRQFQGFRRTERIEKGDDSRPDTLTVFHFLMAQEQLSGNGPEHAALNGLLRRTEVYGLDGSEIEDRPYFTEEADYGLSILSELPDGRTRRFVFVAARRSEDIERSDDIRGEERTYEYDQFGNVVRERLRGFGIRNGQPQPERVRVTETEYAQSQHSWIIDKPSRITVRGQDGTILSEIRRYYDGPDFEGLPLGEVERSLLTREEHLILSQA
ncbi:MAG TPA: toxin TcdB middle/N-terminal domain-containing protein, partial [Acidobacteriota bacterium]|nr:toxin TcdB middle/N-terminal domain-containing protein [Acidobacteriota bacterium]